MSEIMKTVEFRGLEERAKAYKFGKHNWSDWGLLFRFLIVICRLLDKAPVQAVKKTRKPNAWAIFLGVQLKAGKTIQEAAELWRNRD
jgi:hypothetical protein